MYNYFKGLIWNIRYHFADASKRANLMAKRFHYIGNNVLLFTKYFGGNPEHISICDNVIIAADVKFITHDMSVYNIARYKGWKSNDVVGIGKIIINDNAFIGAYSILMPNVQIGKNCIIAAGSVVTKNIPENQVWGGVPAKFIMSVDDYAKKVQIRSEAYNYSKNKSANGLSLKEFNEIYLYSNNQ